MTMGLTLLFLRKDMIGLSTRCVLPSQHGVGAGFHWKYIGKTILTKTYKRYIVIDTE